MERSACVCWIVAKLHNVFFFFSLSLSLCKSNVSMWSACVFLCISCVCVCVCVCVCGRAVGECFPFFFLLTLCVGARIGLSVTVKGGGVGDDRCRGAGERKREGERGSERDGWKSLGEGQRSERGGGRKWSLGRRCRTFVLLPKVKC